MVDALPTGRGLVVSERSNLGIATVIARGSSTDALAARIAEWFGVALTNGPQLSGADAVCFAGTGPGSWLAFCEGADPFWARSLAAQLDGVASVFDQSSGYAVLRVAGAEAMPLLQSGAFIDLHADTFPVGTVAVTVIAHVGAILVRVGEATFDVAVFRSFAGSFWHWLATSAAARGIAFRRPGEEG